MTEFNRHTVETVDDLSGRVVALERQPAGQQYTSPTAHAGPASRPEDPFMNQDPWGKGKGKGGTGHDFGQGGPTPSPGARTGGAPEWVS